ncbi:MAG: hypothetical protein SGILL_001125 [Bacillariaceae sp.]
MLPFVKKLVKEGKEETGSATAVSAIASPPTATRAPFAFDDEQYIEQAGTCCTPYVYPSLLEEAEEMLHVSMLIYSITDLRAIAKNKKKRKKLKEPQRILDLPLNLAKCMQLLEDNADVVREEFGDDEHANTMASLQSIHARYQQRQKDESQSDGDIHNDDKDQDESSTNTTKSFVSHWFKPLFSGTDESIEIQASPMIPVLTAYGDENPETDMVYAVGIDCLRKRITVGFRGSVTTTDFAKDASIHMKHLKNPIPGSAEESNIGIHQGFFDYLLKKRKTESKLDEIIAHVKTAFSVPGRQEEYKLYVTGHSLGGALATIFSFYVAASLLGDDESTDSVIPAPVSCISIASPRCGDQKFQTAFAQLEKKSLLRHLRIANSGDPITVLPGATGKKIWARLSPVSYLAFKLMDNEFEKKETFRHTGLKLRLAKAECDFSYVGEPLDVVGEKDEPSSDDMDSNSNKKSARRPDKIPDPSYHLGKAYTENIVSVKTELSGLSLNDLYRTKVAAIVAKRGLEEDGEQS